MHKDSNLIWETYHTGAPSVPNETQSTEISSPEIPQESQEDQDEASIFSELVTYLKSIGKKEGDHLTISDLENFFKTKQTVSA